jgi:hypothetical protein
MALEFKKIGKTDLAKKALIRCKFMEEEITMVESEM